MACSEGVYKEAKLGGIRAEGAVSHPWCHSHTSIPCATANPVKLLRNVPVPALGADRDNVAPSAGHRRRSARAVQHAVNDDFISGHVVEDQVWIRASDKTAQALAAGSGTHLGVVKGEVDEPLNAGMHLARALVRLLLDISEHLAKIAIARGVKRSFKARTSPRQSALLHPLRTLGDQPEQAIRGTKHLPPVSVPRRA